MYFNLSSNLLYHSLHKKQYSLYRKISQIHLCPACKKNINDYFKNTVIKQGFTGEKNDK